MKKIYLMFSVFMLVALIACNASSESDPSDKTLETGTMENGKPPALTLIFDDEVVKVVQGTYSWSFLDSKTGDMVSIEADSLPPTELVNFENVVRVNLSEPVTLNFEKEPLHYEIRVYDTDNQVIATYTNFKDVKENGKAVFEIFASWEEGTSIYAVALDVY